MIGLRASVVCLSLSLCIAGCSSATPAGEKAVGQSGEARGPESIDDAPIAAIAAKILPAVVSVSVIKNSRTADETGKAAVPCNARPSQGPVFDELCQRFLEQQRQNGGSPSYTRILQGSGFIVDPAGFIVTAGNVVGNAAKVTVTLEDGSRHPAKVVGGTGIHGDLALLKIDAPYSLPTVVWGNSDAAQLGTWVIAFGDPFTTGGQLARGIVSSRFRAPAHAENTDLLYTDVPVIEGDAGGPMTLPNGDVIGVTRIPFGSGAKTGVMVPSNLDRPAIERLLTKAKQKG